MTSPDEGRAHSNRLRAESFGSVADEYDRYRPTYPPALIDRLVARAAGGPVLDVGAGTGRAAVLLRDRGLQVLAVEVDPDMAAVARGHGIETDVSGFEDWPGRDRTYPLITCAQAWHWIDPDRGPTRARALLAPGGTLALFWNFSVLAPEADAAVQAVYEREAPELASASVIRRGGSATVPGHVPPLVAAGFSVESEDLPWTDTETVEHFLARTGTHSDHLTLAPERRTALIDGLRAALSGTDRLELSYTTHVLWCTVA